MHYLNLFLRRPSMRRSKVLALAFLIAGVIFILGIQHPPIKEYLAKNVPISHLRQYFMKYESPKQLAEFDKKVIDFLELQKQKIGRGGIIDAKSKKKVEMTQKVLIETTFINDKSFNMINVPPKEKIPQFQNYDPRFTFGLLLKYINDGLKELEQIELKALTIPIFHWADYVDMTPLEDYIFKTEKQTCQQFDARSKDSGKTVGDNLFDPDDYCIDDGDAMESVLQNPLKQMKYPAHVITSMKRIKTESTNSPALSTGFHIHSWTGRSKTAMRPVISRSYLYDFMPVPLTITFLLPDDKSVQFNVNQEQRKKLRDSELLHTGQINIENEITKLASKLPESSDLFPFEIHLKHEDFIDKSANIVANLEAQTPPLDQTDQHYLAGLKYSLKEENPPKHFREANIVKEEPMFGFGSNYDWRFFTGIINKTPLLQLANSGLLKAFLRLTNRYGIRAWVSHGPLLCWYWNGLRFPWDPDVSVQLPIQDFQRLTQLFNQSIVVDFGLNLNEETRYGRYFLDSTSFLSQRTKGNTNNIIDARFIDLDTGVKIDITALAVSNAVAPPRYYKQSTSSSEALKSMSNLERNNLLQLYNCRKEQFITMRQLHTLRPSMVQGEYGYIPIGFELIMQNEYSSKGTASTFNNNYVYLPKLRIWTTIQSIVKFLRDNHIDENRLDSYRDGDADMISVDLSDQEYIEYLYQTENVFRDFLNTRELTSLHDLELQRLLKKESTKHLYVKESMGFFGLGSVKSMSTEVSRSPLYMDYFVNHTRYMQGRYSFEGESQRLLRMIKEHETNWQKAKEEKERKIIEEEKKKAEEEEGRKKEAAGKAREEEQKKAAARLKEIGQGKANVDEAKKLADEETKRAEQ